MEPDLVYDLIFNVGTVLIAGYAAYRHGRNVQADISAHVVDQMIVQGHLIVREMLDRVHPPTEELTHALEECRQAAIREVLAESFGDPIDK